MLQRDIRQYLFDIEQAVELANQFTAGQSVAGYRANAMLRSAVERQFEIIGEALNQAIKLEPKLADQISYRRQIISLRNRLIHGYASVADDVVWGHRCGLPS